MRPKLRLPLAAALAAGALACLAPAPRAEAEPVTVLFPRGSCGSGRLEVETWQPGRDGAQGRWVPHPTLPRIDAGTCQRVESQILLNEIRVRCIDPAGAGRPSEWVVGADVTGRYAGTCPSP